MPVLGHLYGAFIGMQHYNSDNLEKYDIIISEKVNQSAFVVVYVSERGCRELDRSIH